MWTIFGMFVIGGTFAYDGFYLQKSGTRKRSSFIACGGALLLTALVLLFFQLYFPELK